MVQPVATAGSSSSTPHGYGKMWYKNSHAYGIRQRFLAKKQVFTVACWTWKQSDLEKIADEAISKLERGEGEEVVKAWVKSTVV